MWNTIADICSAQMQTERGTDETIMTDEKTMLACFVVPPSGRLKSTPVGIISPTEPWLLDGYPASADLEIDGTPNRMYFGKDQRNTSLSPRATRVLHAPNTVRIKNPSDVAPE